MDSTGDQTATFDTAGPELAPRLLAKLRVEVPGYQLLDEIGSGGQATVYRARELTSGLTVAIKILHAGPNADEASRERFRRETAALKALNHPNIVCVIESGQTPAGLDYLVMNYVDGKPLDVLWKDRKLAAKIAPEPPARLRLFKKICDLVQAAHRAGITHRDLSPSNILLDDRGEPHVLDFGLAATAFDALMSPGGRNITVTGQFIGKLKYASPEQARGTRDAIDIRTDVYALGVILYQILTSGAFPYEVVGNVVDVLNNIIHSKPMPPSALLAARNAPTVSVTPGKLSPPRPGPPLVNETIEAVVLKALEKDPNLRYESAGALGEDIERYLAGTPTSAKPKRASAVAAGQPSRSYSFRALVLTTASAALTMGVVMKARTILAWLGLTSLTTSVAVAVPPLPAVAASAQQKLVEHLARTETHVNIVEHHLGIAAAHQPQLAPGGVLPPGALRARKLVGHHHLMPIPWDGYWRRVPGTIIVENGGIAETVRNGAEQQEVEVTALGDDLDALWAARAKLEQERMVLWAKIAFRAVADRELSDQPLYRFELKSQHQATSDDQRIAALEAVAQFVRVLDHLANQAQDAVDTDPQAVYLDWHKYLVAARAKMQDALLSQADLAMDVYKPTTDAGQMSAASKQLAELAQTVVDAQQGLAAAEKAQDDEEADASRAQLQDALAQTASAVETLDQSVGHAANKWGITAVPGTKATIGDLPDITFATGSSGPLSPAAWNPTALTPAETTAGHTRIDLLKLVDPARDAVEGNWAIKDGTLFGQPSRNARIEFPYSAPDEYDYQVVFTRLLGGKAIGFICSSGDHSFVWELKSDGTSGFAYVDGKNPNFNQTTRHDLQHWVNGQSHTATIKKRANKVDAYLDGDLILHFATDYSNLTPAHEDSLHDKAAMGLYFHDSEITISSAEVIEFTGQGKSLRRAERGPFSTDSSSPPTVKLGGN